MTKQLWKKRTEGEENPPLLRELVSSKRFRKLLLGYAAVFMLPLVLMYSWIIRNAVEDKQKTLEAAALERLSTTATLIEQKLDYANYIAFEVGENANLRPARLRSGVSYEMDGINDLSKYISADDFWKEVYYVYDGNEKVYTSLGLMDWEVMVNSKFHLSGAQSERLKACVDGLSAEMAFANLSLYGEKQLFYLQPIQRLLVDYRGVLMCQVNNESLDKILNAFLEPMYEVYITDSSGSLLYTRNTGKQQTDILAQIPNYNGVSEFSVNGSEYCCISYSLLEKGWRYTAVVPVEIFLHEAMEMQMTVFSLLTVICLLGACLMSVLSYVNYKPIFIMRNIAVREIPEVEMRQPDDLDAVRQVLDYALEQKANLETSIAEQKQQMVQQTLRHLLSGFKAGDMPILLRAMSAADLRLNQSRMCVFMLSDLDKGNLCNAAEAAKLKSGFDNTHFQIYTYMRADLGALVIVASYEEDEQIQLSQLLYQEAQMFSENLALVVSNECTELTQLSSALNQACSALSWVRESGVAGVVFFSEIDSADDGVSRVRNEFLQAVRQIDKEGDKERVLICAEKLVEQITANHSYEFARMVVYELIMDLANVGREYRIDVSEYDKMTALRFYSFEELRTVLIKLTREITREILNRRAIHEAGHGEELLGFVDENYCNPDLSLKLLSDRFSMSPNYISRIFREKAGVGFSEYVGDKRLQYIKEQLSTSTEPIKDIILSAGYRDVPNFMRKFKQIVGTTPGEYRKRFFQSDSGVDA